MALSPGCAAALPASSKRPAQMIEAYFIVGPFAAACARQDDRSWTNGACRQSAALVEACMTARQKRLGGSMVGVLRAALLGLISLLWCGTAPSSAGDYPNRPVHFINGFAPGGPVDTVARI